MVVILEGDMYMVIYGSNDVIMLKIDGLVEKIYDIWFYVVLGIVVIKNRDILFCFVELYFNEMNLNGKWRVVWIINFGIMWVIIEKDIEG